MHQPDRYFGRHIAAILGLIIAAGCSSDGVKGLQPTVTADSIAALESDEAGTDRVFSVLSLATPDGYQQTVHPDYALMPAWSPRRFLVATPYAFSDTHLENPSLYSQNPDYSWTPHGLNPLVTTGSGYLSDPDMVALEDRNELWIYYRQSTKRNSVWLIRSNDGLAWSTPKLVVSAPKHMIVSPSVVRLRRGNWMMWSVNAGRDGCTGNSSFVELRTSKDGQHWSPPVPVTLDQEPFHLWHIEVQWIAPLNEFWAVYNVKRAGNCNTDMLFLATSPDGVTWKTYPSPLLRAGVIPEFKDIVYRSTFAYNQLTDNIRFWFSGAHWSEHGYVWSTAYQRRSRIAVFTGISEAPRERLSLTRGHDAPLLTNPP